MKRKRSITGQRTRTVVRIGGDSKDPQNIWERILAFVLDRLPLNLTVERTQSGPNLREEVEGTPEEFQAIAQEPLEGEFRAQIKSDLDDEARQAERKKLAAGKTPEQRLVASPAELAELLKEGAEFINKLRAMGYRIEFKPIETALSAATDDPSQERHDSE